jgi:hypothetical protein
VRRSTESITTTSIGARVDSSLRPSCSCTAVNSEGRFESGAGALSGENGQLQVETANQTCFVDNSLAQCHSQYRGELGGGLTFEIDS